MEICSNGHIEICYDDRLCPVCELILEIDELKDEIVNLKRE